VKGEGRPSRYQGREAAASFPATLRRRLWREGEGYGEESGS